MKLLALALLLVTIEASAWTGTIPCSNYTTWVVNNDHLVLTCPHEDAPALPNGGYVVFSYTNYVQTCKTPRLYHFDGGLYIVCNGMAQGLPVGAKEFQPARTGNPIAGYYHQLPVTPVMAMKRRKTLP